MANSNTPFGFQQWSGTGSAPTYEQVTAIIPYNGSAIYNGDPVIVTANGTIAVGAPGTTQLAGIFIGCKYLSVSQRRVIWNNFWPGSDVASSQTVEAYIVNDPNAKFICQTDSTGAAQTDVYANVNFAIGSPNTTSGVSGAYLNMSTTGVTATLPFRIEQLVTQPPGAPGTESGAYNRVIVSFNYVMTRTTTGI